MSRRRRSFWRTGDADQACTVATAVMKTKWRWQVLSLDSSLNCSSWDPVIVPEVGPGSPYTLNCFATTTRHLSKEQITNNADHSPRFVPSYSHSRGTTNKQGFKKFQDIVYKIIGVGFWWCGCHKGRRQRMVMNGAQILRIVVCFYSSAHIIIFIFYLFCCWAARPWQNNFNRDADMSFLQDASPYLTRWNVLSWYPVSYLIAISL